MSAVGVRDMPVIDAWPAPGMRGHYAAAFPDGERTYPSRNAVYYAAARAGAAVRFLDRAPRAAADDKGSLPVLPRRQREAHDASPVGSPPTRGTQSVAAGAVVSPD